MKLKIILFIIVVLTISSCYTVLKHPEVPNEDIMGNVYHQNISSNDNCYKCHTEDDKQVQDYNRYSNYYSEAEDEVEQEQPYQQQQNIKNRWDSYYDVPWWFNPPKATISGGSGGGAGVPIKNSNQTTSNSEGSRTTGSTRTEVNLNITPPTVSTNSNNNSVDSTKNNATESNQPSTPRSSTNSNPDTRTSGSTRGR